MLMKRKNTMQHSAIKNSQCPASNEETRRHSEKQDIMTQARKIGVNRHRNINSGENGIIR